jgi:thioredoxin-like negative regulator of GroEL
MSSQVDIAAYPVLILMFGMRDCDACKAYLPRFQTIARRHPRVPSFAVDCDAQPDASDRFGVRETPTTFFLSYGQTVFRFAGEGTTADVEKLFRHAESVAAEIELQGVGWRR